MAFLAWLVLPSRIPAVGLLALVIGGAGFRRYAKQLRQQKLGWQPAYLEYGAIGLILVIATGLRYTGLRQSLPYLDSPDEPTLTRAAIKMLQTGDFNPHFFRWPSLPFYLQALASLPRFLQDAGAGLYTDVKNIIPEGYYLAGRTWTAALGVGTVFLTYLTGRVLLGPVIGLLSGLIMAVLPLHSEHSHYITPDITVTFFCTLTLLFAALIYKTGQLKWYLAAGVAAGLTCGSKYNVAIILITVGLAHFSGEKRAATSWKWLAGAFGLALVTFILTTPFLIFDLAGFLNELAFQVRHYTIVGHEGASTLPAWQAYAEFFWREAFPYQASLFMLASLVFALIRQRREDWLLLSLPLIGYFFFSSAKVYFARNLLPLLPPLAILSAVFLVALAGWLAGRLKLNLQPARLLKIRFIIGAVTFGIFFYFAMLYCVETDLYYSRPDTRVQAGEWLVTTVPAGAKLRLETNTPTLPAGRYKNADEQRPVGGRPPSWYIEQGFDYLVTSSSQFTELEQQNDLEAVKNYKLIEEQFELVKEFKGENNRYPGPTIRIFKVKK